jgi:hypothetical protein
MPWNFITLKNPSSSTGFEPAYLGSNGRHNATRPPRATKITVSHIVNKFPTFHGPDSPSLCSNNRPSLISILSLRNPIHTLPTCVWICLNKYICLHTLACVHAHHPHNKTQNESEVNLSTQGDQARRDMECKGQDESLKTSPTYLPTRPLGMHSVFQNKALTTISM